MKVKRKKRLAEHELFWLVLITVIILPLVGVIDLDAFSGSLEGRAIQPISLVKEGSQIHMDIKDVEGVKLFKINFKEETKNSVINVEDISMTGWLFEGKVYSKFRVSCKDADKIENIEITLKLKEERLNQVLLAKQDVRLYVEGELLDTKLTKIEDGYAYYETVSDKIGEFIIGREIVKKSVVGKADEVPEPIESYEEPIIEEPVPAKKSIFSRIASFFKNLFE